MYAFLHPALAQTRDYSRSSYTGTTFLSYDTPVRTWNKMKFRHQTWHETEGNGGWIYWALKSSAATLLVGKYVKNWEYNKAERRHSELCNSTNAESPKILLHASFSEVHAISVHTSPTAIPLAPSF